MRYEIYADDGNGNVEFLSAEENMERAEDIAKKALDSDWTPFILDTETGNKRLIQNQGSLGDIDIDDDIEKSIRRSLPQKPQRRIQSPLKTKLTAFAENFLNMKNLGRLNGDPNLNFDRVTPNFNVPDYRFVKNLTHGIDVPDPIEMLKNRKKRRERLKKKKREQFKKKSKSKNSKKKKELLKKKLEEAKREKKNEERR